MSWKFWKRKQAALTDDQRAALRRLVASAKYELIPLDSILAKAEALPEGAAVTVTASPSHGIEATFDLAEQLAARGHDVTPHLSAHMIRDRAHLQELLDRARIGLDHEGVRRRRRRADKGEFHDGVMLLHAIDELGHPFTEIGVPSYPEGHPDIADDVLLAALQGEAEDRDVDDHADVLQPDRARRRGSRGCARPASRSRCTSACRASPSSRSS